MIKIRVEPSKTNIKIKLDDKIVVYYAGEPQIKEVEYVENGEYSVEPDAKCDLEEVKIKVNVPIPEGYLKPDGSIDITENGKVDITEYKYVDVDVQPDLENIEITPTKEEQRLNSENAYGFNNVVVKSIPDEYIIPKDVLDITENGEVDVTKYAKANVNIDTAKPEQSKSTVPTKNTQTILPDEGYVLNEVIVYPIPEEYIVPEGTLNITENGEYNVADKVSVNVTINATSGEDMLQARVDSDNTCNNLFTNYSGYNVDYITNLDTSKVTNMNYMFFQCRNLTTIPQLNTSNVNLMNYMFSGCTKLATIPLSDTSKVTHMNNMFESCSALTTIPPLNTSKVTNMNKIFYGCTSLKSILMYGMKVNFDISASTQFETEDLVTILNNLATVTSTRTLTMGSTNLAKLSDEQKQIAINKGWTLA